MAALDRPGPTCCDAFDHPADAMAVDLHDSRRALRHPSVRQPRSSAARRDEGPYESPVAGTRRSSRLRPGARRYYVSFVHAARPLHPGARRGYAGGQWEVVRQIARRRPPGTAASERGNPRTVPTVIGDYSLTKCGDVQPLALARRRTEAAFGDEHMPQTPVPVLGWFRDAVK